MHSNLSFFAFQCNGGVWWSPKKTYKNAITNELFLVMAAKLFLIVRIACVFSNRSHSLSFFFFVDYAVNCVKFCFFNSQTKNETYSTWAWHEYNWFNSSGMINAQNLVNDGLNGHCANNGGTTWTYNQGVILGGLALLAQLTSDKEVSS